jgi:two-component system sensor histidine kinase ChiS
LLRPRAAFLPAELFGDKERARRVTERGAPRVDEESNVETLEAMTMTRPLALVVEDDPVLQSEMVRELQQARFAVLRAFDYAAAVQHLANTRPDLVCIDLGLPTQSGYELCEHIRARPDLLALPILVTSERTFPEDMAHAEVAGANAFLKKPFTMKKLMHYVAALLDGPPVSRRDLRTLRLA